MDRVDTARRSQLLQDGYCLLPGVLDAGLLDRLRVATDLMLDAQTEEHRARNRSQGSMFPFQQTTDSVFAELIALPAALGALARLGFTEATYTDGYLISKPPHSPQLFWHYGELVIGDARLLHASHPNASDRRRTVLTLWYQPDYPSLPERVKAQMVAKTQPLAEKWSAEGKALVRALHPVYDGAAQPHPRMQRPMQSPAASPGPVAAPIHPPAAPPAGSRWP